MVPQFCSVSDTCMKTLVLRGTKKNNGNKLQNVNTLHSYHHIKNDYCLCMLACDGLSSSQFMPYFASPAPGDTQLK